ncbi:hypothetical protein [Sphingobium sp. Cam5-1]|uniref:hypothetical protein n=1 Tax=Sphingobium sp. Cam5-1 TaxID=2789327 RepID=UPI0018AD0FBA|nr:hypothetical protein [Sphingobium sp. Cam5-1]QPI73894.1 hypothetical protein IZV00_05365 [Sphingobium sp. Cam5-1]
MADRPILFSAPMVRALLEGRKTQTRRILSKARVFATPERPAFTLKGEHMSRALQAASGFRHLHGDGWFWECDALEWQAPATRTGVMAHIGYAVGDRLWVRETHGFNHYEYERGKAPKVRPDDLDDLHISYRADEYDREIRSELLYRPSIFMPRWASRLTLTVTDVRVQRLQDCSEADALAEGIEARGVGSLWGWIDYLETNPNVTRHFADPRRSYASLWDSINGDGAWDANPWVVAVSFDVRKGNIDG